MENTKIETSKDPLDIDESKFSQDEIKTSVTQLKPRKLARFDGIVGKLYTPNISNSFHFIHFCGKYSYLFRVKFYHVQY